MPVVLAITIAAACSKTETANTDTAAAKAADTAAAAPAMYASAGVTDSMKTPESVRYDADLDAYFVSNINGNPSQKDGNGFIARVDAANTSTVTMLAQGGKGGVTLNAPKGMAIGGRPIRSDSAHITGCISMNRNSDADETIVASVFDRPTVFARNC
jgi:hypothetical protein